MRAPRPHRRTRPGSVRNAALITVAIAAFLALVYLLAKQGVSAPEGDPAEIRATIESLRTKADLAAAAWEEARAKLTLSGNDPSEADLALLDAAVEARATLETKTRVDSPLHPALLKLRDDLRGAALHRESLALEKQALALESANKTEDARDAYMKAAELEHTLADKFPSAACKNLSRSVTLESRARMLRAKPLWEQSKADEAEGDARRDAGDFPAAIAAYERAWASHTLLDGEYRGITPADLARTRSLGRKRADANAESLRARIVALAELAEAKAAAGDFDAIPALRAEGETAIAAIASKYPESTYASADWTAPALRRLINAHAAKDCRRIDADLLALDAALRRGDFTLASGLAEGLATEIARVRETFRGGDRPAADTLAHANYVRDIRSELGLIHKVITPHLRPIPGARALSALDGETTQALYTLVAHGDNPSAVPGDNRPVESLTRAEAEAFCQKLGWALGRPVRLPTEAEFRALAADTATLPKPELAKAARSIDTGDGSVAPAGTRAAAPSGMRDALGNVAEWLAGDPARVAGGDAESTLDQLAAIPVREQPATRRSRFVGFRFVVDTSETPPAQ